MDSNIVETSQLNKHFRKFSAVKDLSFSVNKGDVYGFLGQNGAGKSTTIRMMLTLIRQDSGSIKIFGKDNRSSRKEVLGKIGAVVEKPDMYKYLTARENLLFFARLSGKNPSKSILDRQLEQVGLLERADSKTGTFSQGMKQRLGIAVALVHDPDLVILDEPTNGLDPQGIADIRNLILKLSHEQGKTVIVSSHLLNEIEQVATRLLIIDKGKKMVEGNASELFDKSNRIVELDTTDNAKTLAFIQQTGWYNALQKSRDGKIVMKVAVRDLPELHSNIHNEGIGLIASNQRNSLEDYFLQITTGKQHVETYTN